MNKCIVMCGSAESLRRLREAFRPDGIDLEHRDYELTEDITDALINDSTISAVLVVEQATTGLDGGKYGLIQAIRAVDENVRIVFCANLEKRDSAFENWAYKYSAYDFFYPDKDNGYDIAAIAECIKKGRFPADKAAQGSNRSGNQNENNTGAQCGGFGRILGGAFSWFAKNDAPPPKPAYPPTQDSTAILDNERTYRQAVEQTRRDSDTVAEHKPESAQPTEPEPKVVIKEVEVVREIPVDREVIRYVEKAVTYGTYSIAVFNLTHGAGATTMTYGLSEILARSGARVAVVSVDGKNDLTRVKVKGTYFAARPENAAATIQELSGRGYGFIVIDFGTLFTITAAGNSFDYALADKSGLIHEFFRCNLHIGMGFSCPWHVDKIKFFTENEGLAARLALGGYVFLVDGEAKHQKGVTIYNRDEITPQTLLDNLVKFEKPARRGMFI